MVLKPGQPPNFWRKNRLTERAMGRVMIGVTKKGGKCNQYRSTGRHPIRYKIIGAPLALETTMFSLEIELNHAQSVHHVF